VDFLRITQDEKLRMSRARCISSTRALQGVKMGGQVSHNITEVEIVCLPKDLPEFIAVDMSNMDVGQIIHLSEIRCPRV
jgi:large subunit ribosomal protein L25